MGRTRFVRRSLRALAAELTDRGHTACPTTVGRLLRAEGYSPRINVKRFTGSAHPDRVLTAVESGGGGRPNVVALGG